MGENGSPVGTPAVLEGDEEAPLKRAPRVYGIQPESQRLHPPEFIGMPGMYGMGDPKRKRIKYALLADRLRTDCKVESLHEAVDLPLF